MKLQNNKMPEEKNIIEKVAKKVEEVAEEIVEEVSEATEKVVEKIKNVSEKVVEKVEEVVEPEEKSKKREEKTEKEDKELADDKPVKKLATEEQKIFNLYDISDIQIEDPGLKNVINLDYRLVVKSHGRVREKFGKAKVNIVERLVNTVAVPGHRGKKHKIITKWATGKYNKNTRMVLQAFKIIQDKTGKNPIQVLVKAIENGAPRDEVTMIQYGGARYPQAVDCSPLRRVSLALRNLVHGAYDKSFRSKRTFSQTLADEIIMTADNGNSVAVAKRTELERQADSAR